MNGPEDVKAVVRESQNLAAQANAPAAAASGDFIVRLRATGWDRQMGDELERQALIDVQFFDASDKPFTVPAGGELVLSWSLTGSSMRSQDIELLAPHEQRIVYTDAWYKFFKILVQILTFFLDIFVAIVHNYGVALMLLVVLVKGALHRTNYKQQASMLKMQKLAPKLAALKEQYKGDQQKQMQKQMELFKKEGVNPMGGCLPILIQMPIFIALYQTFRHHADMREHSFLWIPDLTMPDQTIPLGFDWPFLGGMATLNILPLIYIAVSLITSFSHKIPQNAGDQQQQIAKIMRWLPVIFGVIFYNMPAGLVLYFCCSAILGTLEMHYIRRKIGGIGTPMAM